MSRVKVALALLASSKALVTAFQELSQKSLSLPNIRLQTAGGEVWWNTLSSASGWRLQQNTVTQHCRILDANNVRIAWGTKQGMIDALDSLVELSTKYQLCSPNP